MMKKKLLVMGVAVALSTTVASAKTFMSNDSVNPGLTLTSNIGGVDVYCSNGGTPKKGSRVITSTPLDLPWFIIASIFHSWNLTCQFYPDGPTPSPSNEIGSATLNMTLISGSISNIETYNGHSMPVITYTADGKSGISVTLNH